jgi:hypothetical protein
VALLADLAAELLDRRVVKLAEAVRVGDLLVVVESSRSALLETKDVHIHCNHVPADDCVEVVEAVGSEVSILIGGVALVVVVFTVSGAVGASELSLGSAWRASAASRAIVFGFLPLPMAIGRSVSFGRVLVDFSAIRSSRVGCCRQRRQSGSDKHKRYAYHLMGSLLAMAVAVTRREPATIQLIKY